MKKILLTKPEEDFVLLDDIEEDEPIFAVGNGVMVGMLVKSENGDFWSIKMGGEFSTSIYTTREAAISSHPDWDFYIKPEIK